MKVQVFLVVIASFFVGVLTGNIWDLQVYSQVREIPTVGMRINLEDEELPPVYRDEKVPPKGAEQPEEAELLVIEHAEPQRVVEEKPVVRQVVYPPRQVAQVSQVPSERIFLQMDQVNLQIAQVQMEIKLAQLEIQKLQLQLERGKLQEEVQRTSMESLAGMVSIATGTPSPTMGGNNMVVVSIFTFSDRKMASVRARGRKREVREGDVVEGVGEIIKIDPETESVVVGNQGIEKIYYAIGAER